MALALAQSLAVSARAAYIPARNGLFFAGGLFFPRGGGPMSPASTMPRQIRYGGDCLHQLTPAGGKKNAFVTFEGRNGCDPYIDCFIRQWMRPSVLTALDDRIAKFTPWARGVDADGSISFSKGN